MNVKDINAILDSATYVDNIGVGNDISNARITIFKADLEFEIDRIVSEARKEEKARAEKAEGELKAIKARIEFENKRLLIIIPDGTIIDMKIIKSVKVEKDVIITMGI